MRFDRIAIVDWSASASPSPARPAADAIWIGVAEARDGPLTDSYHRTRAAAMAALHALAARSLAAGERVLIGADFPFGYPAGFARALTGAPRALDLWGWFAARVQDAPDNGNNRFQLADAINARFPGVGPFWGRPAGLALPHLPDRGRLRAGHGLPERRHVEAQVPGAQPCWKLYTTGSVGSQAILGIAALARFRAQLGQAVAVWPFEAATAPVVLAEVYPSLLAAEVSRLTGGKPASRFTWPVKDAVQVRLLAGALAGMQRDGGLASAFEVPLTPDAVREEGWILGAGVEPALRAAAARVGRAALPEPGGG